MRINVLLFLICLFYHLTTFSQSTGWLWSQSNIGGQPEQGKSVAADAFGNAYVTGFFDSQTITFGSFTLTNTIDMHDFFIVKYSPSGAVLWAKSAGSTPNKKCLTNCYMDYGTGIVTDANGNAYVTGNSSGDSITFGTVQIKSGAFIVKYDSMGTVVWAKTEGTNNTSNGIAIDGGGNLYLTGYFTRSCTFGTSVLTTDTVSEDIFTAKFDATGNPVWAKSNGSIGKNDHGNAITVDGQGKVLVTGYFSGLSNDYDVVTIKYDETGNQQWLKKSTGSENEEGNSIKTDASGNSYITGYFASPNITFDAVTLTKFIKANNVSDVFVLKYDMNGNVIWAKKATGNKDNIATSITLDSYNKIYIAGHFRSNVFDFDTATVSCMSAAADLFLAKYDALSGNSVWVKSTGGNRDDKCLGIAISNTGILFLTGTFSSDSVSFGSSKVYCPDGEDYNFFLSKYASTTGIKSNSKSLNLTRLFPNPSNNIIHLKTEYLHDNSSYQILDMNGRILLAGILSNNNSVIDIHCLAQGIYTLKLNYVENNDIQAEMLRLIKN